MTRLEAVNAVLRRLGLTPVASLDTAGNSAASQAERYLDDADEAVQAQGWHFNKKIDVSLPVDGNSKVPVPAGTFYRLDSSGESSNTNVRVKGGFLYDITNNTDVFTNAVVVSYVERAAWTDLPRTFADRIVTEAAFALNRAHKKIPELDGLLMGELEKRTTECRREDNDHSDTNVLNTVEMNRMRGRQKPYWSNY